MKLSIIIPVYNEESNFPELLRRVRAVKLPLDREIIVVEGGSTDSSRKIVRESAKTHGDVQAHFLDGYCGKGTKVRHGLQKAKGDIVLIQDADLEYDPGDYPKLLEPIMKNETDFVLGSRHMGLHTWKIRDFDKSRAVVINMGSWLLHGLFALLYGRWITDPMSMYKVFRKECLKFPLRSDGFHLDWEIMAKMVKHGHPPLELPVRYKARAVAEGKKTRVLRDGILAVWTIVRYRLAD